MVTMAVVFLQQSHFCSNQQQVADCVPCGTWVYDCVPVVCDCPVDLVPVLCE